MYLLKLVLITLAATIATVVYADSPLHLRPEEGLQQEGIFLKIKTGLAKRYPGARIELNGNPEWLGVGPEGQIQAVHVEDEIAPGEVQFSVQWATGGQAYLSRAKIGFAAYVRAEVAVRRILPGEALRPEYFTPEDVNVAVGLGHEFRGIILPAATSVVGLQTRQTIPDGQFLVSSAVEHIPDVRQGDSIRIHLISGSLTLSAPGTAEESGYLNSQIKVMANKTKRQLVGKLLPGSIVEVRL